MPAIVFGGLCFIGAVSMCFTSETKDRQLPQSVVEMKKWKDTSS